MVDDNKTDAERVVAALSNRHRELTDRINAIRFEWVRFILSLLGGALLLGLMVVGFQTQEGKRDWGVVLFMTSIGIGAGATAYRISIAERRSSLRQEALVIERQLSVEQLSVAPQEDFFTKLVGINFRYIEQYYLQTREQADKSFNLSAAVATVGFLTVIAGIVLMYRGMTQPAYITAASGVLTEFIGAVFFYLYNRTILKMGEYHKKLVLTQNISLALKISENLGPPDKTQALMQLIDRLSQDVNYLLVAEEPHRPRSAASS
jgi:hypothetical protein